MSYLSFEKKLHTADLKECTFPCHCTSGIGLAEKSIHSSFSITDCCRFCGISSLLSRNVSGSFLPQILFQNRICGIVLCTNAGWLLLIVLHMYLELLFCLEAQCSTHSSMPNPKHSLGICLKMIHFLLLHFFSSQRDDTDNKLVTGGQISHKVVESSCPARIKSKVPVILKRVININLGKKQMIFFTCRQQKIFFSKAK